MSTLNTITALVASIRREHITAQHHREQYLAAARSIGVALIRLRLLLARAGHRRPTNRRWAEWVEAHCPFSARTARRYMRIARRLRELGDLTPEEIEQERAYLERRRLRRLRGYRAREIEEARVEARKTAARGQMVTPAAHFAQNEVNSSTGTPWKWRATRDASTK